jgi:hypothetical protein
MIYFTYLFSVYFLVLGIHNVIHGINGIPFRRPFASRSDNDGYAALESVVWGAFNCICGVSLLACGSLSGKV